MQLGIGTRSQNMLAEQTPSTIDPMYWAWGEKDIRKRYFGSHIILDNLNTRNNHRPRLDHSEMNPTSVNDTVSPTRITRKRLQRHHTSHDPKTPKLTKHEALWTDDCWPPSRHSISLSPRRSPLSVVVSDRNISRCAECPYQDQVSPTTRHERRVRRHRRCENVRQRHGDSTLDQRRSSRQPINSDVSTYEQTWMRRCSSTAILGLALTDQLRTERRQPRFVKGWNINGR